MNADVFREADEIAREMFKKFPKDTIIRHNIQYIIFNSGEILRFGYPHSHIGKYTLDIKNLTESELKKAIDLMVKNEVVEKTNKIFDFYNREIDTKGMKLKLKSPVMNRRGLAVEFDNGQFKIVCDNYQAQGELAEFQKSLENAVKTVRISNNLIKMRYTPRIAYNKQEKSYIVVGVQY